MTITADPNGHLPDVVEYGSALLPQHATLLAASAISSDVAHQRGYRSVTKAVELERCGFGKAQRQVPALLIPVHGVRGEIVLHQIRPDDPRVKDGKALKYETPARATLALDVPPLVRDHLNDPRRPLFVTEGARKADAAASIGLCCIALLGVWGWRGSNGKGGKLALPDWELVALNDRDVYIVFDSDVTTKPEVHQALERLKAFLEGRGAHVKVVYLPPAKDGAKVGLDDFLASGADVEQLLALASTELREAPVASTAGDERRAPSQATQLIELAADAGAELFHTPDGEAYATIPVGERRETWPLRGPGFRGWLARAFYESAGGAPGAQAVQDALEVLKARAIWDGGEHTVACRLTTRDGAIYLDLCNERWEAVEVTGTGWRIVAEPPVKFRRTRGMLALPQPVAGGNVDDLRPFVNVASEEDWTLLVAWLLSGFFPTGPYPVLALHGEQGSGKSTRARLLRALVDPNTAPLRAEPRDVRDLMIAARNAWCLAFDNLSHLPPWLSDALCRLATGGGFATRELHSDFDETLFEAQRPLLLTGIEEVATRGDLLDRTILLSLPTIAGAHVRQEAELYAEFEAARPRILGALLDAVAGSLRRQPDVKLSSLPRMADFAVRVTAAEESLGWPSGHFMAAYDENRGAANDLVLEASPVGLAVCQLAEDGGFEGRASELLTKLNERTDEATTRRRGWPADGRALSAVLTRLAPNLRDAGLIVDRGKTSGSRSSRTITIRTEAGFSDASRGFASQTTLLASQSEAAASQTEPVREAECVAGVAGVAKSRPLSDEPASEAGDSTEPSA